MLSSWKEIAQFFGKGVRTVQRWEKTLDLPIRRPPGAPSNVVLARTSDLEEWMHRGPGRRAESELIASPEDGYTVASVNDAVSELEEAAQALFVRLGQQVYSKDSAGEAETSVDAVARIRTIASHLREAEQERSQGQQLRRVA